MPPIDLHEFLGHWKSVEKGDDDIVEINICFEETEFGKYNMITDYETIEFELDKPTNIDHGCFYTYSLVNNILIVKSLRDDEDKGVIMHFFIKNNQLHQGDKAPGADDDPWCSKELRNK